MTNHEAIGLLFSVLFAVSIASNIIMYRKIDEMGKAWIYGTCNDRVARKHPIEGSVQFILWKAGEQGHVDDFWINFESSHWHGFVPYKD